MRKIIFTILLFQFVVITGQLTAEVCGDETEESIDCDLCDLCGIDIGDVHFCRSCDAYWDCMMECPLVLDIENNGFAFGNRKSGVWFDLYGDGEPERYQWVLHGGDDAFLVMDLNENGLVDNGSELFGNGSELIADGTFAANGFAALAQYDDLLLGGNNDGRITAQDGIWEYLYLWFDRNANGRSEPKEMVRSSEVGLLALEIIPSERRGYRDEHGNWLRYWSGASLTRDGKIESIDLLDIYLLRLKQRPDTGTRSR